MQNKTTINFLGVTVAIIFAAMLVFVAAPVSAADSWPGNSGSIIAKAGNLGAGYEPSGLVYHDVRDKLVLVGDDGDVSTMNTDGSNVNTDSPGGDLEGVTITDMTTGLVYVGVENPDSIKEFNLDTGAYTGKTWTLTSWMTGAANQGLEALTFVPNGAHPYSNSASGGLFYAGKQEDGKIYVFDVDTSTSEAVSYVDTITVVPGKTDISGLNYNAESGLIYAIFDSSNEVVEMQASDNTVVNTFTLPGNAQEGISVVSYCPVTQANVYIAEDTLPEVWAYGNYPLDCGGGNGGGNDDGDGDGDDGGGSTTGKEKRQQRLNKNTIVTLPGPGGTSQVRTFDSEGAVKYTPGFFVYASSLRVGFNVATGDLNGDGLDEIVTAPRNGGASQIRIFDKLGNPIFTPGFYAYDSSLRCGVDVATGDLNGNGNEEIITIPGEGCTSDVRIFNFVGDPMFSLGFYAYDPGVTTGFRVASGDLNNDGIDEIITSPAQNTPAHIRTFNSVGTPKFSPGFFAYANTLRSGADVACGDLDGDSREEIITIPGEGFPAQVRMFNYVGKPVLNPGFYAYATNVKSGFSITAGDLDNDNKAEIVTVPASNAPTHTRIFNYKGQPVLSAGFFPYNQAWPLGADVALGKF